MPGARPQVVRPAGSESVHRQGDGDRQRRSITRPTHVFDGNERTAGGPIRTSARTARPGRCCGSTRCSAHWPAGGEKDDEWGCRVTKRRDKTVENASKFLRPLDRFRRAIYRRRQPAAGICYPRARQRFRSSRRFILPGLAAERGCRSRLIDGSRLARETPALGSGGTWSAWSDVQSVVGSARLPQNKSSARCSRGEPAELGWRENSATCWCSAVVVRDTPELIDADTRMRMRTAGPQRHFFFFFHATANAEYWISIHLQVDNSRE